MFFKIYFTGDNMQMKLKNNKFKKLKALNIKLTSKNLFIFLVSFSIITIIIGIIFYYFLNESDKSIANNTIINYFTIKENYNYVSLLKNSILENTFNTFVIWILGISVIGVLASIFIYFCQMFSIGFTIASIFGNYGIKGILGTFCYLITSKICYIIILFILTFFSIKISYKIIKLCFSKEEINLKYEIKKYFKVLLFSFIVMICISIISIFIDPFFIKLFTNIK